MHPLNFKIDFIAKIYTSVFSLHFYVGEKQAKINTTLYDYFFPEDLAIAITKYRRVQFI